MWAQSLVALTHGPAAVRAGAQTTG
ncbi:MAG: hypothetical protein QOD57_4525, partial [Actinomycetota bacterium]|nr:hypothetical protein [Actinomycetota bacterium]